MVKRSHPPRRHKKLKGKGFLDRTKRTIKAIFNTNPTSKGSSRLTSILTSVGNVPITAIGVDRRPVQGGVQVVLNLLSSGKYEQTQKNLKYDNIYHCFFILTLENGSVYRLEKSHIVELAKVISPSLDNLTHPTSLTLNQIFSHASSIPGFWTYDPASNNCQNFVINVSNACGLTPKTSDATQCFTPQDGKKLIESLPGASKFFPKAVTDFAAWGDRVVHGDGIRPFPHVRIPLHH